MHDIFSFIYKYVSDLFYEINDRALEHTHSGWRFCFPRRESALLAASRDRRVGDPWIKVSSHLKSEGSSPSQAPGHWCSSPSRVAHVLWFCQVESKVIKLMTRVWIESKSCDSSPHLCNRDCHLSVSTLSLARNRSRYKPLSNLRNWLPLLFGEDLCFGRLFKTESKRPISVDLTQLNNQHSQSRVWEYKITQQKM